MFSRAAPKGPKEGLPFTLISASNVMEGFVVVSLGHNHRHNLTSFTALHYPSREQPQHFHLSDDGGAWIPTGREGKYDIAWGSARNDLEVLALQDAPEAPPPETPDP